jgi:hypothetical protein
METNALKDFYQDQSRGKESGDIEKILSLISVN